MNKQELFKALEKLDDDSEILISDYKDIETLYNIECFLTLVEKDNKKTVIIMKENMSIPFIQERMMGRP